MSDLTVQREEKLNYSNLSQIEYLRETADFDRQIEFVSHLINDYTWGAEEKADFTKQLDIITRKHKDKILNLTVVGEFGTGKSTCINSLIRIEDFLVSSALQGTTVAATIIEYAKTYSISLEYSDGRTARHIFTNISDLKKALVSFTTDPNVAKGLSNVRIKLPASQLEQGFRIVDTPGTNSNERWHEAVTVRTIKEVSDLVILIIDANKPLAQTFIDFVKTNLSDMLGQCVFLVTRIDMVRKREREKVLDYIREKVATEFGIKDPQVLPYAAFDIMDDCKGEECTPLATASYETEEKLMCFMNQQKALAQTKKLVKLMDALYLRISSLMTDMSKGLKDELNLLNRSRQVALEPFVDRQKSTRVRSFQDNVMRNRGGIDKEFQTMAGKACEDILIKYDTFNNLDAVKKFTNNELPSLCQKKAQELVGKAGIGSERVNKWFTEEMNTFIGSFEKLFEDLEILKIDFNNKMLVVPEMPAIQTTDIADAGNYIKKQVSKENRGYAGKTAAGAAIGTAIAPGIGTVIGGVVGFIFGGKSTEKVNLAIANTKNMLRIPLRNYFDDVCKKISDNLTNHIEFVEKSISTEIDKYLTTYRGIISGRIRTEEEKISQVEKKLRSIRIDIESIESHKKTLRNLTEQINSLS